MQLGEQETILGTEPVETTAINQTQFRKRTPEPVPLLRPHQRLHARTQPVQTARWRPRRRTPRQQGHQTAQTLRQHKQYHIQHTYQHSTTYPQHQQSIHFQEETKYCQE